MGVFRAKTPHRSTHTPHRWTRAGSAQRCCGERHRGASAFLRDDGIDVRQQVVKECGIEDIALDELEAVAVGDWIEVALVARVGQGIEHDDGGAIEPWEVVFDRFTNEVGADKSGSTGDE